MGDLNPLQLKAERRELLMSLNATNDVLAAATKAVQLQADAAAELRSVVRPLSFSIHALHNLQDEARSANLFTYVRKVDLSSLDSEKIKLAVEAYRRELQSALSDVEHSQVWRQHEDSVQQRRNRYSYDRRSS